MSIEIDSAKVVRERTETGEVINPAEKTPDIAEALMSRHVPVSMIV
jgi:hypothetical protein